MGNIKGVFDKVRFRHFIFKPVNNCNTETKRNVYKKSLDAYHCTYTKVIQRFSFANFISAKIITVKGQF